MQNEDGVAVLSPLIKTQLNIICLAPFSHPSSFLLCCSFPTVYLKFRDPLFIEGITDVVYAQLWRRA